MHWLNQIAEQAALFQPLVLIFLLVLSRIGGLVMVAPVFGAAAVPMQVRALLTLTLALLILPTQLGLNLDRPGDLATLAIAPDREIGPVDWQTGTADPGNLVNYAVFLGGEFLVGLVLGAGVAILIGGAEMVGQMISQISGMAVANVLNPTLDAEVPIISQLLHMLALAIFLIIGGHRQLMDALLGTFRTIPLGTGSAEAPMVEALSTLVTQSLEFGVRAAAPAVAALLLSTLVLGLIGRTLPQLNILVIGFGINTIVGLATLALTIGAVGWMFDEQITSALELLIDALHSSAGFSPGG